LVKDVGNVSVGYRPARVAPSRLEKSSTRDASQQWVYQPADNGGHRAAQPDRFDLHVNAAIFLFEPPTGSGGWRLMQRKCVESPTILLTAYGASTWLAPRIDSGLVV
jgi:hypothetical protein